MSGTALSLLEAAAHLGEGVPEREAESALDRSEAFYRSLVEGLPQCFFRKDADGRMTYVNSRYCQTVGAKYEDLIGTTDADKFPEEIAAKYTADDRLVMRTGQTLELVETHPQPGGRMIHVQVIKTPVRDSTGRIVGVQGIFWDVTERKTMEDQLNRERELLRSLMDASLDAIYFKDTDSRFLQVSRSLAAKFGVAGVADVIGKTDADFFGPEYAQSTREDEETIIRRGEPLISKMEQEVSLDGQQTWVISTKMPLRDQSGAIIGTFGISRDVTALKRTETELAVARDAALTSARLKAEFLANMSHEIRTPMNGVLGMTELVLDTELTESQRSYLTMVKTSAEALLSVLNDILDFSKIEQQKLDLEAVAFSLRSVLAETLKPLAFRADEKKLEVIYNVAPAVPDGLVGDPHRIRQILMNLVGNAIKFTDVGQVQVLVDARTHEAGAVELHCRVVDSGIGIPKDKQQAIFEPFRQADGSTTRRFGGTGLGLAIVTKLVDLMGGALWVESEVDQGSTFHFTIRLGVGEQPQDTGRPDLSGRRVLIIDDNPINRQILLAWASRWGMQPESVDSGPPGIERLIAAKCDGRPFDVVLLDLHMPGMDGFEVAARLRDRLDLSGLAVMMLSSSGLAGESDRCRELGVSHFLTKPVDQRELEVAMGRILSGRPATARPVTVAAASAPERRLRVLLAEDNAVNQKLAAAILQKRGHDVTIVGDGQAALDVLYRTPFDVVLMDVQMPVMGGFEATGALRIREASSGDHMPVIAMTAHAMSTDRDRCLAAGMDDYLSKPIHAKELIALVEARGRRRADPVLEQVRPMTSISPRLPPSGHGQAAVLDEAAVAALRELAEPDGPDPFPEIARLFLDHAASRLAALRSGVGAGSDAVQAHAHSLRGMCGTIGAGRLAQLCAELEAAASDGPAAVSAMGQAIQLEFDRVRDALEQEVNR